MCREELANQLGATGFFFCRLNCFWVVAVIIVKDAGAMPMTAAHDLQASIDSLGRRCCCIARCCRLIIIDGSD